MLAYRYAVGGKYWIVSHGKNRWGVVDKHNMVLIPLKYSYIFDIVEDKTRREFIAGEMPDYSHDELYDPETMEHVANRVNGKIIYLSK